jgi:hypothetical protein|tara:strand:+ start:210 stop:485 length:276 start_codon:yes stop_codon:yes gene_type:complete
MIFKRCPAVLQKLAHWAQLTTSLASHASVDTFHTDIHQHGNAANANSCICELSQMSESVKLPELTKQLGSRVPIGLHLKVVFNQLQELKSS